jgi:prepilin-type N-terminal cleavage/methylation domain-containing protein
MFISYYSKKNRGFTLIELLLVISIISLLSSIIMSGSTDARKKARVAVIQQSINQVRNVGELYLTSNQMYANQTFNNQECPTSPDSAWGFIGTSDGLMLIENIIKNSGGSGAVCSINNKSWAISVEAVNLVSENINTAYAQDSIGSFICFDSSNNVVTETNVTGSDGDFRFGKIAFNQNAEIFFCKK